MGRGALVLLMASPDPILACIAQATSSPATSPPACGSAPWSAPSSCGGRSQLSGEGAGVEDLLSSIGNVSPPNVPPPVPAELVVRLLCGFVAGEEANASGGTTFYPPL